MNLYGVNLTPELFGLVGILASRVMKPRRRLDPDLIPKDSSLWKKIHENDSMAIEEVKE